MGMNPMGGGGTPGGGDPSQWLMRLLQALMGGQGPQPGGGMGPGMGGSSPMGGGAFPPPQGPKVGLPGNIMDRTTPDQGTVTPQQGPYGGFDRRMPKQGY